VLVVDDERLARQRLVALLSGEPDIDIVGKCGNGLDALAAITEVRPELVFLDVQMPDLDGLGVITALGADETPEIIFVTAHSAYMERAFEIHAVDCLRKPYPNVRFSSALAHARRRIHARRMEATAAPDATQPAQPTASRYGPVLAALHDVDRDPRIAEPKLVEKAAEAAGKNGREVLGVRDEWIGRAVASFRSIGLTAIDTERSASRSHAGRASDVLRGLSGQLKVFPRLPDIQTLIARGLTKLLPHELRRLKATLTAPRLAIVGKIRSMMRDAVLGRDDESRG
jgi:CheY-like chemotaxis protein